MTMNIQPISCKFSNAYLVSNYKSTILIDTGPPGCAQCILKVIKDLNLDLHLIFITHAHIDHFGSALEVQQHTKAPIAIHRMDSKMLSMGKTALGDCRGWGKVIKVLLPLYEKIFKPGSISPDWIFDDGNVLESFGIPATCIHTPGHTPGSSSLLFDDGSVFVGDLISTIGKPHLQRYFAHDWSQIGKSLKKLQNHDPVWLYPGHGEQPVLGKSLGSL
jgi:hydroxyacylglutathione hydrolase